MARILICHVPKDGSIARDLGAALMGRGHFVSFDGEPDTPRPDRSSRLRQFEAVIVIWTETSVQNAGLSEIAREAMPLNLLVPARSEDLSASRLPLMFRKLNMLSPRDVDGISRVIARLSTAAASLRDMSERDAARRASASETPAASGAAPQAEARSTRPPPLPKAASDRAEQAPMRQPDRQAAAKPVIAAEAAVRARPLTELPEVASPPAPYPPASRPDVRTPDERRDARPEARREPTLDWPAEKWGAGAETAAGRNRFDQDRPSAPVITADDLAKAVEAGLLVHHIPEAMWLGAPTTVELTLGREILAGLIQAEVVHGGVGTEDRQSVETLSVSLYGNSEAFEIERQSERTQFVSARYANSARDPVTFGRWAWLVTPRAAGPQELVVRVSALLRDRHGVPAPVALPDRRFSIEIQIPEGENLVSALAGWYRR
ncbi:hypothetical protein [Hyphomicrobium sp. LHD-15]|uniref:hypothetical protein n=1 Tax=Hyphomicrobium sp. LHD-15 TaxID=3072142 RepID=UPI002810840F|nr:hypothetical protein [Hyphomicrobium sp. LHD-15]MDQ8697795.1 hypothetical protein [Hyphomicrobium sp. LHD-15]